MVNLNALVKSNNGKVWHYGYFNKFMMMWIPSCGQCTSRCGPFGEKDIPEGYGIKICQNCLNHEIPEYRLNNAGLEESQDFLNTHKIVEPDKFNDSVFTVGEQFQNWLRAKEKEQTA